MPLTDKQIHALLVACRETHESEIDCEDFLAAMAEYAEARVAGAELPSALAAAAAHERLCANCREECAALIELLGPENAAG